MIAETTAAYRTIVNGEWQPSIPQWARDDIAHLLEHVMVQPWPDTNNIATAVEWNTVYEQLRYMLDPNAQSDWEPVV